MDYFGALEVARPEQEGDSSVPEGSCHPEVRLLAEEAKIRDLVLEVDFGLLSFIVEQSTGVGVVDLHAASFESNYEVLVVARQPDTGNRVRAGEVSHVILVSLTLAFCFGRLQRVAPYTDALVEIPETHEAVLIDSEELVGLGVEETASKLGLAAREDVARAVVEHLLLVGLRDLPVSRS